jgi:hypothetical protein
MNAIRNFGKVIRTLGLMGLMMAIAGLLATNVHSASANGIEPNNPVGKVAVWAAFNPAPPPAASFHAAVVISDAKGNVVAKGNIGSTETSFVTRLPEGIYKVSVSAAGYSEYTEVVKVTAKQASLVHALLTAPIVPPVAGTPKSDPGPLPTLFGKMDLTVDYAPNSDLLPQAVILVSDDQGNLVAKGVAENGNFTVALAPGNYKISVMALGFKNYATEMTISASQLTPVKAYMELVNVPNAPISGK